MPRRPPSMWVEYADMGTALIGRTLLDVDRDSGDNDHPRIVNEVNEWRHLLPATIVAVRNAHPPVEDPDRPGHQRRRPLTSLEGDPVVTPSGFAVTEAVYDESQVSHVVLVLGGGHEVGVGPGHAVEVSA